MDGMAWLLMEASQQLSQEDCTDCAGVLDLSLAVSQTTFWWSQVQSLWWDHRHLTKTALASLDRHAWLMDSLEPA
jgi:hypothetical protein